MPKPKVLRFGIQSLDKLIGTIDCEAEEIYGIDLSDSEASEDGGPPEPGSSPITSSVCLTGPDGTGKSVLSLHIASQFLADCLAEAIKADNEPCLIPKVFHISTDLTYKMALKGWKHFALDRPLERREPLVELKEGRRLRRGREGIRIELNQYFPSGDDNPDKSIINYLEGGSSRLTPPFKGEVCFVDLASRTAGDDWGFVHRLLSTLEEPGKNDPRHLMVLDAVEGFETLAGDLNAFGEKSSRRSRIAQVMRLAAGKCHLLFVVEEARDERFPEEFVTDVVVRLRNIKTDRYSRRTVEIDKGRGQWSIRGQHPYVIRNGKGSTTGTQHNADEPEVRDHEQKHQSYVHVFPSLNYISREIMIDKYNPRDSPPKDKFAGFGITYLDSMLASAREETEIEKYSDAQGLPSGTMAALIGDSLTQKSQLGRAFLSRAFYPYAKGLAERVDEAAKGLAKQAVDAVDQTTEIRMKLRPARVGKGHPVTVMFTTQGINNEKLAEDFHEWLAAAAGGPDWSISQARKAIFREDLLNHIRSHTICRRFEIHDVPSPILMHIFQRNIEKAQRMMFRLKDDEPLPPQSKRFQDSWRIRVVIDDLNGFRNMFPEMRDDPLMLPSLLLMLRREGVTSLIIDTQTSGSPELSITERFDSSVRELVQYRIYTWRLPFYGENRVAISLIPPISQESRGVIRELRWENKADPAKDRSLRVDPHFELYMGLEQGKPQPVPLKIRLYAETPSVKRYIEAEEKFLREMFTPVTPQTLQEAPRIIEWTEATDYDALRDSSRMQRDTRLDHTMLLQVDEFWGLRRATQRRAGAFRQQWSYLNALTAETQNQNKFMAEAVVDPLGVFQPPGWATTQAQSKDRYGYRLDFFDQDCGYEFNEIKKSKEKGKSNDAEQYIDRVPFTWDFGFLLCNGKAWAEATDLSIGNQTVAQVWRELRKSNDRKSEQTDKRPVPWRKFLAASKVVSEFQSYRTSTQATAFDFTMLSPEGFSCLILEMWLSESYMLLSSDGLRQKERLDIRTQIVNRVGQRRWRWDETQEQLAHRTLLEALVNERYMPLKSVLHARRRTGNVIGFSLELYKVWLLLIEALNFAELVDSSSHLNFEFKSRAVSHQAVSARHSYKTASTFIDSLTPEQLEYNWVPVRLPGHFSVRADWFLAVAGGSRSSRLADNALDLLSSQRANVTRLQEGIGLPTRKLFAPKRKSGLRTRLILMPEKGKPLASVEYEELRRIGAPTTRKGEVENSEEFYWLWRSGIWAYNRYSRIWHRWLNRTLLQWHSWRQRYSSNWKTGFEVYDLITEIEFAEDSVANAALKELENLDSWKHFHELRDILIAELEQVSISTT